MRVYPVFHILSASFEHNIVSDFVVIKLKVWIATTDYILKLLLAMMWTTSIDLRQYRYSLADITSYPIFLLVSKCTGILIHVVEKNISEFLTLHNLRNRFLLTVMCCPIYHCWRSVVKWIYHECKARVIYSLTTDRQPVIYWATNHLLARINFNSNTRETTKKQLYPSDFSSFPPLHKEIPPTTLTVIEAFIS